MRRFLPPKNLDPETNETTLDLVNKTLIKKKRNASEKSHGFRRDWNGIKGHSSKQFNNSQKRVGFEVRAFVLSRADVYLVINVEEFVS